MDVPKLLIGTAGHSEVSASIGNIIPIRPSTKVPLAEVSLSEMSADRFTPSSIAVGASDGVDDTVNLTSTVGPTPDDSERAEKAAAVVAAVQAGNYQVNASTLAAALISSMLGHAKRPIEE